MHAVTHRNRKTKIQPLSSPTKLLLDVSECLLCCWCVERALWVFAGQQYIQSLCVQPGEGMSSGEDIEQ